MKPPRRLGSLRALWRDAPAARGLLPLAALLVLWQVLQPNPSPYFPPPSLWWEAALRLGSRARFWEALGATSVYFLLGLAAAIALGTAVGVLLGQSRLAARALGSLLEFMRAIPPPAVVPVAALLIGYGAAMRIAVIVLAAVWPVLLNVAAGVNRIDPLLMDVSGTFRLTAAQRIRRIVLPAVVPALLLGIRVAIPLAIVVALLVEMLTSLPGLGALMIESQRNYQSSEAYALLVLVGLFGFLVNHCFAAVEAAVLRRWPPRRFASS